MIDTEHILNEAQKYDYITFDVFDTLIIRDVMTPADVFTLSYGSIGRYLRIIAEMIARKLSKNGEVTLKSIQKYFYRSCEEELKIEKAVCRANPEMLSIYKTLKSQGKKLYAISDMYLSSEFITSLLQDAGYDLPVIVSCEELCGKQDGSLFKRFLEQRNISSQNVLHIGDSQSADYEGAQKAGIAALLIARHTNQLSYIDYNAHNPELASFINHGINEIQDPIERIGYEIIGPIILGFCQWVHIKKDEFGFDKLYFLARDMRFSYEVYRHLYEDNTAYLCISRKSLKFARENTNEMLKYLENEGFYGNVAIVDTGWVGVAQTELDKYAKVLKPTSDIGGLYLGTKLAFRLHKRSERSSSCYFASRLRQFECGIFPPFMETLIGTNEPQVIKYSNGEAVFDREKSTDQTNLLKSGASKFISQWVNLNANCTIDTRIPEKAFRRMIYQPKKEHIELIKDLHYEDFKSTSIVSYDTNVNYLFHPRKMLNDLSLSAWKGAFLKQSGILYPFLLGLYKIIGPVKAYRTDIRKFKNSEL